MRRIARLHDWYRRADATANLPGVTRLRRMVRGAKFTGLRDSETQPITLKQAKEVLALVDDSQERPIRPRYEVQVYHPMAGWQPAGARVVATKEEGLRLLRGCAKTDSDYRLVRLIPKVLALKRCSSRIQEV